MSWNCGTMRMITWPMPITSAGMLTTRISDSGPSSRMARITPPTSMMGAATNRVQTMTTRICTCWTSLVIRVMSDGAPKCPTSWAENPVTWWKRARRTSRPKAIAARAPK